LAFFFSCQGEGGALNEIKLFIPLWVLLALTALVSVGIAVATILSK
jgi:hypothetical protein